MPFPKGKHLSEEARKKITLANMGRPVSEYTKDKIRKALIGKKRPAFSQEWREHQRIAKRGKKIKPHTEEHKRKIGIANRGRIFSEQARINMGNSRIGKKHSAETRRKLSELHKGEKCIFWMGGISYFPYSNDWTETLKRSIRERDNYICKVCDEQQLFKNMPVHHIDYNKLNCNPDNLITLCRHCHSRTNYNRKDWIKYFKYLLTK